MIRSVALSCVLVVSAVACAWAQSPAPAPIVFFDIAAPDSPKLQAFYADIFGWKATPAGTFTAPVTAPLPATFRKDPAEILIYLGVADITATLAKVQAAGGSVVFPRLVVPGTVVIGMFRDPAGSKVGLVEIENGTPKVR